MNLFPRKPQFSPSIPKNENIRHKKFTNLNREEKDKLLLEFATAHYQMDKKHPFDQYSEYFGISLKKLLKNKKVLDLGCSYGGKTVSFAERWGVKEMVGTEVNDEFVRACKLYTKNSKGTRYSFEKAIAEKLPFRDDYFDGIVSYDVLEHVKSLDQTFSESHRVLRDGGIFLGVFPPYYMPTEAHLTSVTYTPCLQWIFRPEILMKAYDAIVQSRGTSENYWYYKRGETGYDWATLHSGIGINGTTIKELRRILKNSAFSEYFILKPPLLSVGRLSLNKPLLSSLSKIIKPLANTSLFEECLTHRIVLLARK